MKILIIANCYPTKELPYRGIFTHQQVLALKSNGAECHVIQPVHWFPPFNLHTKNPFWEQGYQQLASMHSELDGVQIHHPRIFKKMPSRFFKPQLYEEMMGKAIASYILKHAHLRNADVMWANFLLPDGYAGVFAKRKTKIPLAASALGDDVHAWVENNPVAQKHLKIVFEESDLLLANSARLAEDTKHWMDKDKKREVYTIYNGVNNAKFFPVKSEEERNALKHRFKLNPEKNHLICVATPVKLKGWLELLDAIQLLKEKFDGWELVAVAPPRQYNDGLDLISESVKRGIQTNVKYVGQVDPDELPYLLRACDAFTLPSYNEGMANALLEAMSTGLPVVATDVGGHREILRDGVEGIMIAPQSLPALKDGIEKLTQDPELRKRLGSNARTQMLSFGNYKDNAQKLVNLFEEKITRKS